MALRFRRSMKIAPGVRVNLTKKGVSARVGPRGAGVTVGTSGTTVSAGAPGTGLHVSEKIAKPKSQNRRVAERSEGAEPNLGWAGWIFLVGLLSLLVWGAMALLG